MSSVIKPLWAAVLLEQGFDSEKIYQCKGYTTVNGHTYHCANNRAHGEINMEQALVVSYNCYFIDAEIENKGFIFRQMANVVDFGESIKICDNLYTSRGDFPTVEQMENMGIQSSVCFGQGNFRTTPIHTIAFMNVFANNGVYVFPQVVEAVLDGKRWKLSS